MNPPQLWYRVPSPGLRHLSAAVARHSRGFKAGRPPGFGRVQDQGAVRGFVGVEIRVHGMQEVLCGQKEGLRAEAGRIEGEHLRRPSREVHPTQGVSIVRICLSNLRS